jgi:acyl-CoA synthetase (AMP-forming)/AMP-acid ligase II
MNVATMLLKAGRDEDPAVLSGDKVVSYGRLREMVDGFVAEIEAVSEPGDRIGIVAENSDRFAAAYLGSLKAGRVAVPMATTMGPEELRSVSQRMGLRAVVADARHRKATSALTLPVLEGTPGGSMPAREVPGETLAALMLTSGSTAEPKAVMVSHDNIASNTRDIVQYLGLTRRDRVMVVLPFHYCYGLSLLHTHLAVGASLVLNNAFHFAERMLDEMERSACTGLAGVPATYQMLLRKTSFKQRGLPALTWLQQAGGPLSDALIGEVRSAVPHARLFVMYGQTEATARLSYLPPERLDDKLGSIGRGLPSTRLRVLRQDGTEVTPGSDEVGEVVAEGPNITLGYWQDPEETERYFREGRLWTGDLARIDGDGFVYVVGRAREFIKVMGVRTSPTEIEAVITELPSVTEAAVFGVPDSLTGEAVVAVVVPSGPGTCDEVLVRKHCAARLPSVKVPARIHVVEELPKTRAGKVARADLKKLFGY